jgi:hypothetical protein
VKEKHHKQDILQHEIYEMNYYELNPITSPNGGGDKKARRNREDNSRSGETPEG